jgi:hypothetical protein
MKLAAEHLEGLQGEAVRFRDGQNIFDKQISNESTGYCEKSQNCLLHSKNIVSFILKMWNPTRDIEPVT